MEAKIPEWAKDLIQSQEDIKKQIQELKNQTETLGTEKPNEISETMKNYLKQEKEKKN